MELILWFLYLIISPNEYKTIITYILALVILTIIISSFYLLFFKILPQFFTNLKAKREIHKMKHEQITFNLKNLEIVRNLKDLKTAIDREYFEYPVDFESSILNNNPEAIKKLEDLFRSSVFEKFYDYLDAYEIYYSFDKRRFVIFCQYEIRPILQSIIDFKLFFEKITGKNFIVTEGGLYPMIRFYKKYCKYKFLGWNLPFWFGKRKKIAREIEKKLNQLINRSLNAVLLDSN